MNYEIRKMMISCEIIDDMVSCVSPRDGKFGSGGRKGEVEI